MFLLRILSDLFSSPTVYFFSDDLDIHVITPDGSHIAHNNTEYYLDDQLVGQLDHDDRPEYWDYYVENVHFNTDGSAPKGAYKYYVHNYRKQGGTLQMHIHFQCILVMISKLNRKVFWRTIRNQVMRPSILSKQAIP